MKSGLPKKDPPLWQRLSHLVKLKDLQSLLRSRQAHMLQKFCERVIMFQSASHVGTYRTHRCLARTLPRASHQIMKVLQYLPYVADQNPCLYSINTQPGCEINKVTHTYIQKGYQKISLIPKAVHKSIFTYCTIRVNLLISSQVIN